MSQRLSRLRTAGYTVLFTVSFAAVSMAIRPDFSTDRILQAKWDHWNRSGHQYDAVFFGSSRIYRAFDPREFTAALPSDEQIRIFNFSVGSMRPCELSYQVQRLLQHQPSRLRVVFIELMDWHPAILSEMKEHQRTVDWHTPTAAWRAIGTELPYVHSWQEGLALWNQHLKLCLQKLMGFGTGPVWWKGRDLQRAKRLESVMAFADGFVAFDQESAAVYGRRRREFLVKNRPVFRRQVAKIDSVNQQAGLLDRFDLISQTALDRMLHESGLEVIYVIPNLRWGTPDLNELARQRILKNIWSFNHVEMFPELYDEQNHFDRGHLNRAGAKCFSRRLAERYLVWRQSLKTNGQ